MLEGKYVISLNNTIDAVQKLVKTNSGCSLMVGCPTFPSLPTYSPPSQTLWVSTEEAQRIKEISESMGIVSTITTTIVETNGFVSFGSVYY